MDCNRITELLNSNDITYAEIITYHYTKDQMVIKTTTIDYGKDNDYQRHTSVPLMEFVDLNVKDLQLKAFLTGFDSQHFYQNNASDANWVGRPLITGRESRVGSIPTTSTKIRAVARAAEWSGLLNRQT